MDLESCGPHFATISIVCFGSAFEGRNDYGDRGIDEVRNCEVMPLHGPGEGGT